MPTGVYEHKPLSEELKKKLSLLKKGKPLSAHHKMMLSKCHADFKGSNSPSWKGGKYKNHDGYIYCHASNHPNKTKMGYVREHRLVIERIIGRYLKKGEIVHHKNGIVSDNSPENLVLCKNQKDHLKHHKKRTKKGE